jgi:hypothetical protein
MTILANLLNNRATFMSELKNPSQDIVGQMRKKGMNTAGIMKMLWPHLYQKYQAVSLVANNELKNTMDNTIQTIRALSAPTMTIQKTLAELAKLPLPTAEKKSVELASKQFEAQFSELLNKSGSELDAIQKELRELVQKDEQITHRDDVSLAIIEQAIQELNKKLNQFVAKQAPILHQLDTLRRDAAALLKTHDKNRYLSITEEVKQSLEQESHLFTPIH